MTFTNYPGHLVVVTVAAVFAVLTFIAFRSSEVRAPARRGYRWLLMLLQYATILLLLVITWNPSTLQTRDVFERNNVVTLFDTSESMSVADDRKAARLDKAIERFTARFHPDSPAGPEYKLYGFDRRAYHCGSLDLLRRWGSETDLHAALSLLAGCMAHETPAGAVIFTDGRVADGNVRSYPPLVEKGIPVFFVGVGSRTPRTDVAIKSIAAPARAWIDTAYPVAVTVTAADLSKGPLTVELLHDDQVVDSRKIPLDQLKRSGKQPNTAEATLEFTVPAQHLGTHVITAHAVPRASEANVANNARSASVEVTQEQTLHVLLYSQQASFDVGKIRQALAWDRRIELDVRLDVIRDPVLSERVWAASGSVEFPPGKEELYEFDMVVLGPCDPSRFTPAQREALYGFVANRGGGLLLLPGAAATSPSAWGAEQAGALLPVILDDRDLRAWPPRPETMVPSFEAQVTGIFDPNVFTGPAQSISAYYNVVRVKPASTTLVTAGDAPIITAHRLGRGRVCLLNASKLFKLYREDRKGGLLANLICPLAAYLGATPSAGTGVDLFVERRADDPRRAVFSAYVTDKRFEPVNEANVLLSVGNQVVKMQPSGEGRYTAQTNVGLSQSVVATVEAESNGVFLGERTVATNLPPIRDEMSETDLDEGFLKSLAQHLGATYLHIDDVDDRIAKAFVAKQRTGSVEKISSAWPRWSLLLVLCLLLSIKWFLRRTVGLV